MVRDFPGGSVIKNQPANAGNMGSIPGLGRFPWRRKWLYPCQENPMNRRAWWATVHRVTKSQT